MKTKEYIFLQKSEGYDYGIAILRIIMTFVVVLCHYWNSSDDTVGIFWIFHKLKALAVPSFMLLSFWLAEETVCQRYIEKEKIKKRFLRLLVPYIGWPLIYVIIITVFSKCWGVVLYDENYGMMSQLLWQLLFGSARNLAHQFWYIAVLIGYTVIVIMIFKTFEANKAFQILFFIASISLFLQYSGLHINFMNDLELEQKVTMGRFIELLPYIVVGLLCAKVGLREWVHNNVLIISASLIMLYTNMKYPLFSRPAGYGYSGTYLIFTSFVLLVLFFSIPFEYVPNIIKIIIKFISKYSMGIYGSHVIVGNIYNYYIESIGISKNKFSGSVVIWCICLGLSVCIAFIPSKVVRQLVQ